MDSHLQRLRVLAGYLAVAGGIALLFLAVAVAALRPLDGLAWVRIPPLGADFGLDAGLKTRPLQMTVVAEALRDRLDGGGGATSLVVAPALTLTAPSSAAPAPTSAGALPTPVAPPGSTAPPGVAPTPPPAPTPTPAPTPSPTPCNKGQGSGAGTGNCKR